MRNKIAGVCVLLLAVFMLSGCNSTKHANKKRRKMAPCDCPKFNHLDRQLTDRTFFWATTLYEDTTHQRLASWA